MRTLVVRYQTKPDRADENQALIERVFAELAERKPGAFGYTSLRLDDGVSFVHIVHESGESGFALTELAAFQEFVAGIADRCVQPPVAMETRVVGAYEFTLPRV